MTVITPPLQELETNTSSENLLARASMSVMDTYKRVPIVFEFGEGCILRDTEGKQYLDFVAGIAVNTLGHAHPRLTEALSEQCAKLMHCSNLYWTEPQIALAERLTQASGLSRAFFCNSGAEAVEAALKLARKFRSADVGPDCTQIIAMTDSFHGRTYGALSVTGQSRYHVGFSPLLPDVTHAPFNDIDALRAKITSCTAAVILEPIQGEGGIRPADPNYLRAVRALCDETGVVLIFDEVQSGVGRTGRLFAFQQTGVRPDILVLAKGLGGGFPIGAILASERVDAFTPGDHASTFGGNPLACVAAQTVLDVIAEEDLLSNVITRGKQLREGLLMLQQRYPDAIHDVRGVGLMQGVELTSPVESIVTECRRRGLLLVAAGANVIRFVPPLIVRKEQIAEALSILESALVQLSSVYHQ
jgi:acetylornithine aminotransferase/acetylornithine/N-succinyldiaminopimelate aminotransferase